MKDSLQYIGVLIGQSDLLIIISRCCYGGYSSPVKAILDRAIGDSLTFFTWRGGQTHHISNGNRVKRAMILGCLLFGVDLILFNSFMPLVFDADIPDLIFRTFIDILAVTVGCLAFPNQRNANPVDRG